MLISSINNSLNGLIGLLNQLPEHEYSKSCFELSGATIGEHIRHIVEMFQCLNLNYDSGLVNYDKRERNVLIETNIDFAVQVILDIQNNISKENKNLELQQIIDGVIVKIQSNYHRELLYNLEHCIHHQALIKVAVLQYKNIVVDENFGVARSTIEYRKQCAQ
jgi:hypothetical protein